MNKKFCYMSVLLYAFCVVLTACRAGNTNASPSPPIAASVDRNDALYHVGERINFIIKEQVMGQTADSQKPAYYSLRMNDFVEVARGTLNFANGEACVSYKCDLPGFFLLIAEVNNVKAYAGAACDPEKLAPSMPAPDDFRTFWQEQKDKLDAMPFKCELTPVADANNNEVETYKLTLDNINGTKIHGYFAKPRGQGPFPLHMEVHCAGVYGITHYPAYHYARRGIMAVDINPHDITNGQSQAYYEELRNGALKNYWLAGRDNRDTSYFLRMFCSCYRAAQWAVSRPEWDKKHFLVSGASQGGGQAFVTAALCPKVTAFAADIPALCDHTGPQAGRMAGWPGWIVYEKGAPNPAQLQASRYFDCVNFAAAVRPDVKALVSLGFIDCLCAPSSGMTAYNTLKCVKQMLYMPKAYHQANRPEWMAAYAEFEKAELGK